MFVGPGLGVTQRCGVGALVWVYTPTRLRTHLHGGGRCRACDRREIGATGPSLADHPGRPLPPPFAGMCWAVGPAGCWTVAWGRCSRGGCLVHVSLEYNSA